MMYLQIGKRSIDMLARLMARFARIRYNIGIIWEANTNPKHRNTPCRYLSVKWDRNQRKLNEEA